jgi:hypothetical protein
MIPAGNLVTLRDWFDLSLKEGLTQFRQQLFASDVDSASVAAAAALVPAVSNDSSPLDALLAEAIAEAEAADNASTSAAINSSTMNASSSSNSNSSDDDDYEEPDTLPSSSGRKLMAASGPTAGAWQATSSSSSSSAVGRSLQPQVLQLLRGYSPSSPAAAAADSGWQRVLHAQRVQWTGALYDELRPDSFWSPSMMYTATVYDKVGATPKLTFNVCYLCCIKRPDSFWSPSMMYTATVYDKVGATLKYLLWNDSWCVGLQIKHGQSSSV